MADKIVTVGDLLRACLKGAETVTLPKWPDYLAYDRLTALCQRHFGTDDAPGLKRAIAEVALASGQTQHDVQRHSLPGFVALLERAVGGLGKPEGEQTRAGRRKRKGGSLVVKRITDRQREIAETVAHCQGNVAEAARRLGIDESTARQSYKEALRKLGQNPVRVRRPVTRSLPKDKRGQIRVTEGDDRRH